MRAYISTVTFVLFVVGFFGCVGCSGGPKAVIGDPLSLVGSWRSSCYAVGDDNHQVRMTFAAGGSTTLEEFFSSDNDCSQVDATARRTGTYSTQAQGPNAWQLQSRFGKNIELAVQTPDFLKYAIENDFLLHNDWKLGSFVDITAVVSDDGLIIATSPKYLQTTTARIENGRLYIGANIQSKAESFQKD